MELLFVLLLLLIVVGLAANRWGHDSRDSVNSLLWSRGREHY
jgi:hypothetical protein